MNMFNASLTAVITFALFFPSTISHANDTSPIAKVEILEDEIEIEYIDTTVWDQWVFDTDTTVEYMYFDNDTGEIPYKPIQVQGEKIVAMNDTSE